MNDFLIDIIVPGTLICVCSGYWYWKSITKKKNLERLRQQEEEANKVKFFKAHRDNKPMSLRESEEDLRRRQNRERTEQSKLDAIIAQHAIFSSSYRTHSIQKPLSDDDNCIGIGSTFHMSHDTKPCSSNHYLNNDSSSSNNE